MNFDSKMEQGVEQGGTTRTSQANIAAALAAARAGTQATLASPLRFPGEDGGRSLAEMAQRDLDAALQLLADRAQYITGANGAAIALRRDGRNDMLCRASTGSNVPELGALLSTEFGLSGESVRTRRPLRCDDAERDPRVNREGCRELGIASVVVMPVVNDDEVLGVFELFSGKVNAFGERDLSALQRLSQMVETAVKLARAAETVTGKVEAVEIPVEVVAASETPSAEVSGGDDLDDQILEVEGPAVEEEPIAEVQAEAAEEPVAAAAVEASAVEAAPVETKRVEAKPVEAVPVEQVRVEQARAVAAPDVAPVPQAAQPVVVQAAVPKKPLFWSVALNPVTEAEKPAEADQSHVPPMLRNLKTCEACGFPVSPGRALCVECEEKKWRGQLKVRKAAAPQAVPSASSLVAPQPTPVRAPAAATPAPVTRAFAAAAPAAVSVAPGYVAPGPIAAPPTKADSASPLPAASRASLANAVAKEIKAVSVPAPAAPVAAKAPVTERPSIQQSPVSQASAPAFVLSAGLEPSQSWFSRNKYVVGAMLIVAATVAAIFLLR